MHLKATTAMQNENLSGNAAARPFLGKHVDVDCVVGDQMMGMFGGLGFAFSLDPSIWFVAGPHDDFDVMKWMQIMKSKRGQRVRLLGVVVGTETPGSWSPLMIAVTGVK